MPELTAQTGFNGSSYKEVNFDKQNDFVKKLPKLVQFAHVQPSGLTEIAGTDYP